MFYVIDIGGVKMKNEDLLTVGQVSELANVSKQSIYKRLDNTLSNYVVLVDNQKMLKREVLEEIYKIDVEQCNKPKQSTIEQQLSTQKIEMLERMLADKQAEIDRLREDSKAELERVRSDIDYFKQELAKANERAENDQQIIKMLTAKQTLEIEQKEDEMAAVEHKKGFFGRIFG